MNIIQEFVERNDLLLGKVAEDNPSLGAALIEALAVINYYATTNNVSFDDAKKEQILAVEEVTVQEPTVAEKQAVKPVLKKIDEAIAASHQMTPTETKWVIENWDDRALYALLQKADSENIAGYITLGEGANAAMYFLILDEKLSNNSGFTKETQDLIDSQKQMKRDELDDLLKGKQLNEVATPIVATEVIPEVTPEATPVETHTPETPIVHASKEFVEDDILVSEEDLEALKQLEDLEDLGDINLDDLDI